MIRRVLVGWLSAIAFCAFMLAVSAVRANAADGVSSPAVSSSCSSLVVGGSCFPSVTFTGDQSATVLIAGTQTSCASGTLAAHLYPLYTDGTASQGFLSSVTSFAQFSGVCHWTYVFQLGGVTKFLLGLINSGNAFTLSKNELWSAGDYVSDPTTTVTANQGGSWSVACSSGCSGGGGSGGTVDIANGGVASSYLNNLHDDLFVLVGAVLGAALIPLIVSWFTAGRRP